MDQSSFICCESIRRLDSAGFLAYQPFPWVSFDRLLTPVSFQKLYRDFPSVEWFEKHEGLKRHYSQRPHNRYYLAYQHSNYHFYQNQPKGVIKHDDLPESWRLFIGELEGNEYRNAIKSLFRVSNFKTRYAWHIGVTGSEVSPHRDMEKKIGTHIFYFNTSEDWYPEWGGETMVLGGKRTASMNPEFEDFDTAYPVQNINNRSFLFKNTENAWHGVRALNCPPSKHRRLFNVIFDAH